MALTQSKYIVPSSSPVGGNQATQSSVYGDADINSCIDEQSSGLVSFTNTIAGTPLSTPAASATFSHGALTCRIANNILGTVTQFVLPIGTNITPTYLASSEITYIGASSTSSSIVQSATPFTPTQTRTIVPIGKLLHHDNSDLTETQFRPVVARATGSSFNDFLEMTGPVTSGFKIGTNTVNNALSIGPGRIMVPGIGMDSAWQLAPNTIEFAQRTNHQSFRHVTQDGTLAAAVTQIDTTNYNASGNTLASYSGSNAATRSIWQGFDGTVYVLYPTQRDSNGENAKTQGLWYQQPVPHWMWEVAVPIALLTAEHSTAIFDNTVIDTVTPIIDQLQPIPTNWPHRTVQATVFPS